MEEVVILAAAAEEAESFILVPTQRQVIFPLQLEQEVLAQTITTPVVSQDRILRLGP